MRMWMLDPKVHCRKHLLGAHVECHMLLGSMKRKKNLGRFISDGLVDPRKVIEYHDSLASEMKRRGYRHNSPVDTSVQTKEWPSGIVDSGKSVKDLSQRCEECRNSIFERIKKDESVYFNDIC